MRRFAFVEGDGTRLVASYGSLPAPEFIPTSLQNSRHAVQCLTGTVHIHDIARRR